MRIVVISTQEHFREQTQATCLRYKDALITLRTADSIGQGMEIAEQIEAEFVILDLTHNVEAGLIAIEQLAVFKNRVIAASCETFTTDLMARAIRAGARQVIEQPVREEDIRANLDKALRYLSPDTPQNPQRSGRLVVCFSSKGGVGKTTLACNLAVTLAMRLPPGSVGIVDANQQVPNVAPMLDLRPERWLRDAIREHKRLDGTMLEQFLTAHRTGLLALAHNADEPLEGSFTEDQLCKVLLVCKGAFRFTMIDTFPLITSVNLAIMDLADKILLVTEAVVPSVRTARHNLRLLRQAGYGPERIEVVLNRYTSFKGNVTPAMVAETLDWPVESILPYDVHTTIAANQGRTIAEMYPDRPLSRAIVDLAVRVAGTPLPPLAPPGLMSRLTSIFR